MTCGTCLTSGSKWSCLMGAGQLAGDFDALSPQTAGFYKDRWGRLETGIGLSTWWAFSSSITCAPLCFLPKLVMSSGCRIEMMTEESWGRLRQDRERTQTRQERGNHNWYSDWVSYYMHGVFILWEYLCNCNRKSNKVSRNYKVTRNTARDIQGFLRKWNGKRWSGAVDIEQGSEGN